MQENRPKSGNTSVASLDFEVSQSLIRGQSNYHAIGLSKSLNLQLLLNHHTKKKKKDD